MWLLGIIIVCFVLAALVAYGFEHFSGVNKDNYVHYVLMVGDKADSVEWTLRRLRQQSRWSGRPIQVTIVKVAPATVLEDTAFEVDNTLVSSSIPDEVNRIADIFVRMGLSVTVTGNWIPERGEQGVQVIDLR
jgi:hypothetical protein